MDRLDTCVSKLNQYGDYPATEEDFLIFTMFSCMTYDAVKQLLASLNIEKPVTKKQYFKDVYEKSPIFNPDADIPTDEKFFEYIRSLIFAHPFGTNRPRFLHKNEIQYSPWVIVNSVTTLFEKTKDAVGVRIYSNQSEKIFDLKFSFLTFKQFISCQYNYIKLATEWAKEQIASAEAIWKKAKIEQNQSPIDMLVEIDNILTSRFSKCYSIKDFIEYLTCSLSDDRNLLNVDKFRKAIAECIPDLCVAVNNLDNEKIEDICDGVLKRPNQMHKMAYYQLEKIFNYLGDKSFSVIKSDNEQWGLIQAESFYNEMAHKWVYIDIKSMPYSEIKLLVTVACYLERKEQEKTKQ